MAQLALEFRFLVYSNYRMNGSPYKHCNRPYSEHFKANYYLQKNEKSFKIQQSPYLAAMSVIIYDI